MKDCDVIEYAFLEQGWKKTKEQYERYLEEQNKGIRDVLIATMDEEFCGYLTISWVSDYQPFFSQSIPEIKDLNVLKKFQNRGIATLLLDEAERRISLKSRFSGIGVGLLSDYGAAQKLYVKKGYVPDGLGISQNGKFIQYFDQVIVDDDLNLFLIKSLK